MSRQPDAAYLPTFPQPWWQTGVIYQIYPFTFADDSGNGTGDLQGIIRRLDYLNDGNPESKTALGIDAIWLSPINKSPMADNGYDVSDYTDICPIFGTLKDFEELLTEAHKRGIKVIMDLVINHTSNQHSWFVESASSRDNSKRDWYIWQDSYYNGGYPNNWRSYFGGEGWTYCDEREQYYFHTFNKNQPDLNWRNPEVRDAIYSMIRFWLDKGVDGFRLDASSVYSKDKFFRDNPAKFDGTDKNEYNNYHHLYDKNLPENHQIIREIRRIIDSYDDRVLIGETFIDSSMYESTIFYGAHHDELHLPFDFEFPFSPWYPSYLQRKIEKKEKLLSPPDWPTYFLDNHDLPRHLSRWVECSLCTNPDAIAKAAATILLTVRGTPVLYYGQELGMLNNTDIPPEKRRDNAVAANPEESSPEVRDGARTPMQWDTSAHAGFSFGKAVEPWLPVHENYTTVNVATELADEASILNFYRQLIRLRKQYKALQYGRWRSLIHYPNECLAYVRETEQEIILIVINFGYEQPANIDHPGKLHGWTVLLSTRFETDKIVDIPETLDAFEISILHKTK